MTWQPWEPVLAAVLAVAVVTDLRRGLIPNWLTLPAMAAGLALGGFVGGWAGLGWAAVGLLAGGLVFLPAFVLGGAGGGDVKLLAAVGALGGPVFGLKAAAYACLAGGAWALARLARAGKLRQGLAGVGRVFRGAFVPGLSTPRPEPLDLPPIRFGVCIAVGALWAALADFLPGPTVH